MRIHIWSSNGEIIIDETGAILDSITYLGGEFPAFTRFDTAEFVQCYGKLDNDIDILDIGMWHMKDGVEKYEPAEPDFRKQVQDCLNNPDLC